MAREGAVVLGDVRFGANIPVRSVAAARTFYEGVLGVTTVRIQQREIIYRAGNALFGIYETEAAGKAGHTLGTFSGVDDVQAIVTELRRMGVVFEEYDMPGITTVDGIANFGPEKVAWFRDPDGNLLSIDDARLVPTSAQP
jgi:catechol 2,3-dioxygenase-like lactoylglutathione lyase family enzyme